MFRMICAVVFLTAASAPFSVANAALSPESPEVQRLLDSGFAYLSGKHDDRVGGQALIGMCFVKRGAPLTHPQVAAAVNRCQACADDAGRMAALDIYSLGLAIIFLCEADSSRYASDIDTLFQELLKRQKPGGGWGYPPSHSHGATGDTSMTQYGVLALWMVKNNGLETPTEAGEKVCNWLIRTQDPGGGWGYQGKDPGVGVYKRIKQDRVRPSLCAAAAGSTYICADLLDFNNPAENREVEGLPTAFLRVVEKKPPKEALTNRVSRKQLHKAQSDGNRWFTKNFNISEEISWVHYYMYALERYMSFRELAENRKGSGAWYDAGVRFLERTQLDDGSWSGNSRGPVDTAFALLFLMRSTKKSIQSVSKAREGLLVGGRGLPSNTSDVKLRAGRVVGNPLTGKMDSMLAILDDPEHEDFDYLVEFPGEFELSSEPKQQAAELEQLRRLAKSPSAAVRKVAVHALARSGRLDAAPVLIEALLDDDLSAAIAARDGLRRMSRKFRGFGLADRPTPEDRRLVYRRWRDWYAAVRLDDG